jgi:hypothetical protein
VDHAEATAKKLIEALIDGAEMRFHADQSRSVHDFDLQMPDGTVEAFEVTASIDREIEEMNAAIIDPKKGGISFQSGLCRRAWHLHPGRGARIVKIRKDAGKYLAELEAIGVDGFFGPLHWSTHDSIRVLYEELRVLSGAAIEGRPPGEISLAHPGGGGSVGAVLAHEAVIKEVEKTDNRKKLEQSGFRKRHLGVYIHALNYLPWVGLIEFDPPVETVTLPNEITDVWAYTESREPNTFAVWRVQTNESWRNIGPVRIDAMFDSSE